MESHQYGMPVAKITLRFSNTSVFFVPIVAPLFSCSPADAPFQLDQLEHSPLLSPASCCMEEHGRDSRSLFLLSLSAADLGMI